MVSASLGVTRTSAAMAPAASSAPRAAASISLLFISVLPLAFFDCRNRAGPLPFAGLASALRGSSQRHWTRMPSQPCLLQSSVHVTDRAVWRIEVLALSIGCAAPLVASPPAAAT